MRVVIVEGPGKGSQFPLPAGEHVAGREPECPVYLPSRRVSRRHAVFHSDGKRCVVQDAGSANGMVVNGHRMDACELTDGTQIQFGDVLLVFQAREAPAELKAHPTEEYTFDKQPPPFGGPEPPPFGGEPAPFGGGPGLPSFGEPQQESTITRDVPPPAADLDPTLPPPQQPRSPAPVGTPAPVPPTPAADPLGSIPWLGRVFGVLVVAGMLLTCGPVGGFFWLVSGADGTVEDMAAQHGVLLCEGLGHRNASAIARNDQLALDVDFVLDEPGVKQAWVLDQRGDVIAPANKTTQTLRQDDLFLEAQAERAPIYREEDGGTRIITPIRGAATEGGPAHGTIVGYAVLTYDVGLVAGSQASFFLRGLASLMWLALALLLVCGGVWFLAARPLKSLRDETELAMKTGSQVAPPQGWPEAAALVHSINRVLARASGQPEPEPAGGPPDDGTVDALLAASTFPVFLLDAEARVVKANDWAGHLAGVSAAQLAGRPLVSLFSDGGASDRLRAMIQGVEAAPVLADRFELGGSERQVTVARAASASLVVIVL